MFVVYLLALGAALLFGIGNVVQQHAAAEAPPQDVMSFKLLLWLVRRPVWLAGVATAGLGNGLSATALGLGSIALVEPLLGVRLLFALPLAAAWRRCRVPGAGLGRCGRHRRRPGAVHRLGEPDENLALRRLAGGLGHRRRSRRGARAGPRAGRAPMDVRRQAPMLAAGAGLLFGLQAAVTSVAVDELDRPAALFTSWYPYVIVAAALTATLFLQSAYEMAPLHSSFPAQVTAEPICGIALGVTVLSGSIRVGPAALAGEVAGLLMMVGGLALLGRSKLVARHPAPPSEPAPVPSLGSERE